MKKRILSLSMTLLLGLFSWSAIAAAGWFSDYIKLDVNGAGVTPPTGWYWIGDNPSYATQLDAASLGNVTSLKLDGADMKYWGDGGDRTGGSFFYEVKSADGVTTYTAATEVIWTQTALGGNDFQGLTSGLNVDLLTGIPAGTACKITVWAKSWGTTYGDSWLNNGGANYVATFTKASVSITGATGIANGTSYTTLKGAFDAINANASGVNTDNISIQISDNTTETATALLSPGKGINTLTTAAGSGYQAPVITIGGTKTGNFGTLITTITNGVITSIAMSGGTLTAAASSTVTIAAPAGGGTTATATATRSGTNLAFTITNGGTGYGPSATFSGGDGTGAAVDVKITTGATTLAGAGPWTATPATVGLTYILACPGSGYTSIPACAISAFPGATAGTVTVATLYPAIEYNSLAIYPTVAGKTISGAVGLISIVGRKNVIIDGRVNRTGTPAVGSTDNLTISCTHNSNAAIAFTNNAQNDTIQYCTIRGMQTSSPQGTLNFGSGASLANGNGLNVIDHNLFTITTSSGTVPSYSIYAQGNSTFPNVGNKITNNEFKDVIAQYVASTNINIQGGVTSPLNDNYTISGNSFYNTAALTDYAASNLTKIIIGIGASSATFGGSHTITDNYIGGTAANCGGSTFTKTARETTFYGMLIYPSPSVSGGGATSIQNNTIKKISWANDYYTANWFGISIGGGTGAVNIGTETGNTIGDNTTNGSITVSNTGTASVSATLINLATTGTVNCQNNKIGSIATIETTANYVTNIGVIVKTGAGTTNISYNIIGSATQANSISATSTGTATQNINVINCNGTGTFTVGNNTIANITSNATGTSNIFPITMSGTGLTGAVNGNLIHSISIVGATTGTVYGIWCGTGTNTLTNNIVKLGDNNSYEIRAIGDASAAVNTSDYHNTVYLSGTPTTLSKISSCLFSSGQSTIRSYKNNIFVNNRSNAGTATGAHYAFNGGPATGAGTLAVDGNDYISSGTGGVLGLHSTDKTTLPIVTGQDASSLNVDPAFANAGGTTAEDYKPTGMLGVSGTAVGFDYAGTARANGTMGAYEIAPVLTTSVSTLEGLNYKSGAGPEVALHSFDVSGGTSLSGNITVTAPANFEVSKTGLTAEFTPSVTVAPTSGSVAVTTIYVRLVAGLSVNTYTGDVTISAAGAVNKTVACAGSVDFATGLKAIYAGVRVFASFGEIKVIGAKTGDAIEVYNGFGQKVKTLTATQSEMSLSLPAKGIYVIKVGSSANKVIL